MRTPLGQLMLEVISDKTLFDVVHEMSSKSDSDDPFYVVDLSDVVVKHKLWNIKLPRVQPYYAVKCNDDPVLLELLASLGTGFECRNKAEIESILTLGVNSSRVVYANPSKTKSAIRNAAIAGVDLMTFDNETELHKIQALHSNARLLLLINADKGLAQCNQGIQFGCQLSSVPHLLETAKDLGLSVVGISFHFGFGNHDYSMYSTAILSTRKVFDLAKSIGFEMTILDLGGGFSEILTSKADFEQVSNTVNEALEAIFPVAACPDVTVIAGSGEYYLNSAVTLCTSIIAKRVVPAMNDENDHVKYYINDGVYGSFNSLLYEPIDILPVPLKSTDSRPKFCTSIWGPTCDSLDRIVESCDFPLMNVGEWLLFENMDSNVMTSSSAVNGCPKPVVKFILHSHTLAYLRQLPSAPNWMEAIDEEDWSSAEGADEPLSALLNLSLACC